MVACRFAYVATRCLCVWLLWVCFGLDAYYCCLFSLFVFTGGWLFCLLWLWLVAVCAVFGAFVLIVLVALRWRLLCYELVCVDCLIA